MSAPSWTYFCFGTWPGLTRWSGGGWEAEVASEMCYYAAPWGPQTLVTLIGQVQARADQRKTGGQDGKTDFSFCLC